mmetsp:Transcript_41508/g.93797  ORF Transcript_41508/g.93797 Transcript_41508/m.93797 type:complete len:125 (+) Transcript_41508:91-465(+)
MSRLQYCRHATTTHTHKPQRRGYMHRSSHRSPTSARAITPKKPDTAQLTAPYGRGDAPRAQLRTCGDAASTRAPTLGEPAVAPVCRGFTPRALVGAVHEASRNAIAAALRSLREAGSVGRFCSA